MSTAHERAARRVATGCLMLLLAAPLVLSAHRHGSQEMQGQQCTACTLVRHSPVISSVGVATLAPDVCNRVAERKPSLPLTPRRPSPRAGRAPPSFVLGLEA